MKTDILEVFNHSFAKKITLNQSLQSMVFYGYWGLTAKTNSVDSI